MLGKKHQEACVQTKLETWLAEYKQPGTVLTVEETRIAVAIIEKLKAALTNQAQLADMLGHSDGSDYANYAGHITMESIKALIDLDPEKL